MNKDMVALGRKQIIAALVVFMTVVVLIVTVNSFGHGLDLGRSVSRYVGFEAWSSVVFTISNAFVVAMAAGFLWELGQAWKMPRLFYYVVFLMATMLILLSVFPIGFCDFDGHVSLVSRIHEISSRVMFLAMMLVATMITGSSYSSSKTRIASTIYVIYSLICVGGYLTSAFWFIPWVLFLESAYVVGFLVMLLFCKTRSPRAIE